MSATSAAVDADGAQLRRNKDQAIESLRGIAAILVVAAHIIGLTATRGMRVSDDSVWRFLYVALVDVRLPLFTVISGYVYAMRPIAGFDDVPGLLRAKSRRLLVPLAIVGTLLFVLELAIPGTNEKPNPHQLYRVYLFGFEHLWFLQSIFLIFIIVGVLEAGRVLNSARGAVLALTVSLVMFEVIPVPDNLDVFSVSGVLRLLPFFILGYILNRYRPLDDSSVKWLWIAVTVFVIAYGLRLMTILGRCHLNAFANRALSALVGLAAVLVIVGSRNALKCKLLAWIGGFSFGIYLLHPFATSAARMGLARAGVTVTPVVFFASLACGVAGPIVFQQLSRRSRVIQTGMFGQKWAARPKSMA